jgi:ADP-ribose pyrophosphatase
MYSIIFYTFFRGSCPQFMNSFSQKSIRDLFQITTCYKLFGNSNFLLSSKTRYNGLNQKKICSEVNEMVWKINNSMKKNVDRFVVTIDEVTLPTGEKKTFSYLSFAKGVCILPITDDHEVVCIKQYRHAINSRQWELPAGMVDDEEQPPLETAKRELEEETGYTAEYWLELGSFYPSPGSTSEEIFLFAAAGLKFTKQNLENSEQIEVHKVTMEKLKTLVKDGEFQHGAGLAAILRYKFLTDDEQD